MTNNHRRHSVADALGGVLVGAILGALCWFALVAMLKEYFE